MKIRNYVASVSGGKDSIAMFEGILERGLPLDTVIFFNNGMEFPCILRNMQKVRAKCLKRGIEYIELTPPRALPILNVRKTHRRQEEWISLWKRLVWGDL